MTDDSYTLKQVARIVARTDDEDHLAKVARQIRHWTSLDIIPTIGKKHSGTGVHRRYSANAVRRAALTSELARYGLDVSDMDPLGEYFDGMEGGADWQTAIDGTAIVYLWYSLAGVPDGMIIGQYGSQDRINPLQLTNARRNEEYGAGLIPVEGYASALVINVTKVFQRLTV